MPLNPKDKSQIAKADIVAEKVRRLYLLAIDELVRNTKGLKIDPEKPFNFNKHPQLKAKLEEILNRLSKQVVTEINEATSEEWLRAVDNNNLLLAPYIKRNLLTPEQITAYTGRNLEALKQFQKRKINGLGLSERIWKYSKQFRSELEMGLDLGLQEGKSASQLSRELRQYLEEPNHLYRRVRDKHGNLHLSKNAKKYKPEQGVYRSSYKNAMRLTRTEINMSYRASDYEKRQQFDFVIGVEIKRSNKVFNCGVCESLKGKYPKDFKWLGWHPQCYSDDTEVYTKEGWKLFKDVTNDDKILSLNLDTKNLEYVDILLNFRYWREDKMIHFHSKNIDYLVTPEHEVFHLNRNKDVFKRTQAKDYTSRKGYIYRSSEYQAEDVETININGKVFNFDAFCEFMGYWLSDGSLIRKSQIKIAQLDENRTNIAKAIEKLDLEPRFNKSGVDCYCRELNSYLRKFGTSAKKYIPIEIKNASTRQIKIFLDAFVSCDGHTRQPRTRVKKDGRVIVQKLNSRHYCTTSEKMAGDLGELILKIGKRPSFTINKTKGQVKEFKNGTYTINHDLIVVNELHTQISSSFDKDIVDYKGYVYDLTLSKNATMYIRRNGKCFWGSNCRCHAVNILNDLDEFIEQQKAFLEGKEYTPSKQITKMPDNFNKWVQENTDKIKRADKKKTLPYFLRDNRKFWEDKISNKNRTFAVEMIRSKNTNPYITIHKNADQKDLKRNYQVANVCASKDYRFTIREHIEQKGLTNPEYLINGKYLADRKSIESNNGVLSRIKSSKKQMLNDFVNPNKMPYFIVFDLDNVKGLDWGEITHNISKQITEKRGKKIKGLFFQYKGKATLLTREEIVKRNYKKLDLLKITKAPK